MKLGLHGPRGQSKSFSRSFKIKQLLWSFEAEAPPESGLAIALAFMWMKVWCWMCPVGVQVCSPRTPGAHCPSSYGGLSLVT